jgi:hypothetical protein
LEAIHIRKPSVQNISNKWSSIVFDINTNGSQNIVTNIKAIIEDFSILGDGIVKYIKTLTQKWEKK